MGYDSVGFFQGVRFQASIKDDVNTEKNGG